MVDLRVVSYNIRSLRDDRSAVVRVLRTLDADVVCIQEAPRFFRWRSRCAALARESGLLYVGGGGSTGGTMMLTSLRVDVRSIIEYRFSRTPVLHLRGAVAARLHRAGASVVVASVHLGLDADERARHRTELFGLVDRFDSEVTVLAGDVNEAPDQPTWRAIAAAFTDTAAGDETPTFSTAVPRRRIDGVFVRGPARIVTYRVMDDPDVLVASDHRPVVVDLQVDPNTSTT
ncbi:MAG TPA: endonuclease/exonuclease/phosphatase family protein [Jiangellaceae bacterium]|nr:endonuclease/exonuclease/phosphatase family protein [Jiangellaceae bacterium]